LVLSGGEGPGGAAGPLFGLCPLCRVGVIVRDDVADPELPAGAEDTEGRGQGTGLSADRLMTQSEMSPPQPSLADQRSAVAAVRANGRCAIGVLATLPGFAVSMTLAGPAPVSRSPSRSRLRRVA
jgi:hypothetical protein